MGGSKDPQLSVMEQRPWRQAGVRDPTSRRPNTTTPGSTASTHHKTCWTLYKFLAKKRVQETWPSIPFSLQDKRRGCRFQAPPRNANRMFGGSYCSSYMSSSIASPCFIPGPAEILGSPCVLTAGPEPVQVSTSVFLYSISFCAMAGMNECACPKPAARADSGVS